MSLRSTATGSLTGGFADGSYVAVNNDLTNVSWTFMYASTTSMSSSRGTNSIPYLGPINGAGTTASTFSNCEVYFADYTNAFSKQMKVDVAAENNSATNYFISNLSILHGKNNPITSIQVYPGEGSWAQYSTITLYGISERFDTAIPTAPVIGTVTDQAGFASVAFTPASNDQADSYVVTSTPSNATTYGVTTPITTPATLGTSYTYQVASVNSLGTSQSAASSALTTSNSYASIATFAFTNSSSTSVSFTSIPQNYTHLQLRIFARGTGGSTAQDILMTLNNDGTSSYWEYHQAFSTGVNSYSNFGTTNTFMYVASVTGTSALANNFGSAIVDIHDYASSAKNKSIKSLQGWNNNGSGNVVFRSNMYTGITPISTITLSMSNFAQYSHIALYGLA
jgi:hypothetical protein